MLSQVRESDAGTKYFFQDGAKMRVIFFLAVAMLPLLCSNSVELYSLWNVGKEEVARFLGKQKPIPILFDDANGCFSRNDMETVKEWVLGEGDANSQYGNGLTLLRLSIYHKKPEMAVWLIEHGADINYLSGQWGYSPLQYAISKGSISLVPVLINVGANLDLCNAKDSTALHTAALEHDAAAVEMLLNAGANPLVYDQYGHTPLHRVAVKLRSFEDSELTGDYQLTAKLLIDAGVEIDAPNVIGQTALYNAVDNGAPDLVRLLVKAGADPNFIPPDKRDALFLAVTKGSLELTSALVEAGADMDAVDEYGVTALFKAARDKHFDIATYLVDAGADPTIPVKGGVSALHFAAYGRETELCRKMIAAGAVPDLATDDGATPLLFAAEGIFGTGEQQAYDTLALFLEYDQNVNVANSNSMYPIHYAATAGYIECAKLLLDHGARVDVRTKWGLFPIHNAARYMHKEMVPLLTSDTVRPDIYVAFYLNDVDWFKTMVADGADLNQGFENGHSVLTMAAWTKKKEWVDLLLGLGADVNSAGDDGSTALMKSCVARRKDIALALLDCGADPDQRTYKGASALHIAANYNMAGIVSALLSAGASPNAATSRGETPLHWAATNNDVASANELIIGGADVNVQNEDGETPFFLACKGYSSDLTTAILLLRWSANPCIRDNEGNLPKQNHSPQKTYAEKLADLPPPTYSPSWFGYYSKDHQEVVPHEEDPEPVHVETPEERVARIKNAIGCCE